MATFPLHEAAKSGDVEKVRELLEQGKYDVNSADADGATPLHCACSEGHLDLVRVLVSDYRADARMQNVDKHSRPNCI